MTSYKDRPSGLVVDENFVATQPVTVYTKEGDENRRWQNVKDAYFAGSIIFGPIVEVRQSAKAVYAVLKLEDFDVLVPDIWFISERFFNETYERADDDEKLKRRYQAMRAAVGAYIHYKIRKIDRSRPEGCEDTIFTIVASRLDAMAERRKTFFLDPEIPEQRKVEPGKIVECHVITVGENGVRAEACGVDFYINNRHLSLIHPIMDARDYFGPGSSFFALVQKVYINEGDSVYLQASVRQLEHERIKDGYKKAHVGSTVAGYVCDYNKEKHCYTIVLNSGCYASCHRNSVVGGETLALGDGVSVQIKAVRTGYVSGTCMKINTVTKPRTMIYSWDEGSRIVDG